MIPDKLITNPIKFKPIFKEKIWGGQKLKTVLSKDIPKDTATGESWELSGYGTDLSTAFDKENGKITIQRLLEANPKKLLGNNSTCSHFPLLYKFIDARDKLSVQVHPDDSQAREFGWGNNGKTESWYITDVKPDGEIILGFKESVTINDVKASVNSNTLETILNRVPISKGDVLFCPAGTVHSILEGTLIYEIQETSDTTFRLYDWGRVDNSGISRQLHREESLKVIDLSYHNRYKIPPVSVPSNDGVEHLFRVACNYFALEEYILENHVKINLPPKTSFTVITVINGSISLYKNNTERNSISKGETIFIPADYCKKNITAESEKDSTFLLSTVPDLKKEIINYLRKMGISDEDIAMLGGAPFRNDIIPLL